MMAFKAESILYIW